MTHKLKIEDAYYEQIISGEKNFEVRFNDRGYQKGDNLEFKTIDGFSRDGIWEITYVHSGMGLNSGWVVLGIVRVFMTEK